jgi:hypothetical protein
MVSEVSSLHSKSLKNNRDGTKTRLIESFGQLLDHSTCGLGTESH